MHATETALARASASPSASAGSIFAVARIPRDRCGGASHRGGARPAVKRLGWATCRGEPACATCATRHQTCCDRAAKDRANVPCAMKRRARCLCRERVWTNRVERGYAALSDCHDIGVALCCGGVYVLREKACLSLSPLLLAMTPSDWRAPASCPQPSTARQNHHWTPSPACSCRSRT